MIDIKELEHLAPMANEMLSGLHADETMKRRILFAANENKRRAPMPRLVPALCCAALAIACVSAFAPRLSGTAVDAAATPMPVSIDSIAAGGEQAAPMTRVADVSGTARVRAAGGGSESLFRLGERRYSAGCRQRRGLSHAQRARKRARRPAGQRGRHGHHGDRRALLADDDAMAGGLSNVAEAGQTIYAVSGLDANTAVACEVGGNMRLFQRVSYAGKGPGGLGLEDTILRPRSGRRADAFRRRHADRRSGERRRRHAARPRDAQIGGYVRKEATLTATLTNGLKLQLGVSGDTVSACGGWSCPEFFGHSRAAYNSKRLSGREATHALPPADSLIFCPTRHNRRGDFGIRSCSPADAQSVWFRPFRSPAERRACGCPR